MAQDQLIYKVVLQPDEQSIRATKDAIAKAQQEADAAREKSKGTKKGTGESKANKEEARSLDELTRKYMALTREMSSNQQAAATYRQSLSQLNRVKKKQGGLTEEQANEELALKAALADVNKDINANKRDSVSLTQANRQLGNSYNDTKKRMAAISSELRNLQDPFGKNAVTAQKLSGEYDKLNNRLKSIDKSMGNHQRNVGNYENAIRSAANAVAVFQGPLGPLAGRINSAATVMSRMAQKADRSKKAVQEKDGALGKLQRALSGNVRMMEVHAGATALMTKVTKAGNAALMTYNVTLKAFKVALAATGIGALLIAVAGLYNHFTRTEEGAQRLRVIMAQLGARVETLRDRSSKVGKAIVEAFSSPQAAVKALWSLIKSQLINRVTAIPEVFTSAFGIVSKAAQGAAKSIEGIFSKEAREEAKKLFGEAASSAVDLANSVQQIGTGIDLRESLGSLATDMANNVEQAGDLERALNAVKETERALGVERANVNAELQAARDIANDTNNSFEERLSVLDEAQQKEDDLLARELANEEERLRIFREQNDMFDSTEAQLQAVADQEAKVANIRSDASRRSLRITRDRQRVERQLADTILRRLRREIATIERRNEIDALQNEQRLRNEGRAIEISKNRLREFDSLYNQRLRARTLAIEAELERQGNVEDIHEKARQQAQDELQQERIELEMDAEAEAQKRREALLQQEMRENLRFIEDYYDERIRTAEDAGDQLAVLEARKNALIQRQDEERATQERKLADELVDEGLTREEAEAEASIQIAREHANQLMEIDETIYTERERRAKADLRFQNRIANLRAEANFAAQVHSLERINDKVGQLEQERTLIKERQERMREQRILDLQEQFSAQAKSDKEAREMAERQLELENAEELAENQRQIDNAVFENKKAIADATLGLATALNSALFNDNKAVGASIAVVNTLIGITRALRSADFPLNLLAAAKTAAIGFANVRKILSTPERGGGGAASGGGGAPSASFGLVDTSANQEALANAVAGNTGAMQPEVNPTIILDGEFDPELMSVKVREGNRAISGRTINMGG